GEELAALLGKECPAFFARGDRVYYHGIGLLHRARGGKEDKKGLIREAVGVLEKVPLSLDLEAIVPQLALSGEWAAIVALTAQRARALDPLNVGLDRASPAGEEARRRRQEGAYVYFEALLDLVLGADRTPAASLAALASSLSDEARASAGAALVDAGLSSEDALLHERVFEALLRSPQRDCVPASASPHLEGFLIRGGGLAGVSQDSSPTLASSAQLERVRCLARMYVHRSQFAAA
ncbi:hypothetical protein H632_c3990p0, partial [Helicosporidium sp. ATCC 50920]